MVKYHNLNGEIVNASQAQIYVNDVGLLRGYGIFDFFPVVNFKPLFEEDYFNRFFTSAQLMNLTVPISRAELHDRVVQLAKENQIGKGYMKLVLTGGYAADGYTPGISNLFILQHEDINKDPAVYAKGITLLLQKYLKDQPQIKTLHYANALKKRDILAETGAMDLLYHDGRNIRETSRANFFIVDQNDQLHTTEADVLSGITRKHVINVARKQGYSVYEERLPLTDLLEAKECFITSTTKGILPVSRINDLVVGSGKAGEVSIRLQECYLRYCDEISNTINS